MSAPGIRLTALALTLSFLVAPALAIGPELPESGIEPVATPNPCKLVDCSDPAPDPCEMIQPCPEPEPPCFSLQVCDPDPDPCPPFGKDCPPPDPCEVDPKSCDPCPPGADPRNCDPCPNPDQCDPCEPGDPTCCDTTGTNTTHCDPCDAFGQDCHNDCGCPTSSFAIELNTGTTGGVKNAYGAVDPDWTITASPFGAVPAYSVMYPVSWVPDSPVATWIDPQRGGTVSPLPVGTYVYEVAFALPAGSTSAISLRYSVDDEVDFYLQPANILIGGVHGGSPWTSYHFASYSGPGLVAGTTNRLVAVTTNAGANVHGLFVEATVKGTVGPQRCIVYQKDLSTGTNPGAVPFGTLDDDWYTVTYPTQTTLGPFGAYAIQPALGWTPLAGARWINPFGAPVGTNNPAPEGSYVYAIDFTLPCRPTCDNIELDLEWAADDEGALKLNGLTIDSQGPPAFAAAKTLSYHDCRGFLVGTNHLYAQVENNALWTGLLVRGTLTVYA